MGNLDTETGTKAGCQVKMKAEIRVEARRETCNKFSLSPQKEETVDTMIFCGLSYPVWWYFAVKVLANCI